MKHLSPGHTTKITQLVDIAQLGLPYATAGALITVPASVSAQCLGREQNSWCASNSFRVHPVLLPKPSHGRGFTGLQSRSKHGCHLGKRHTQPGPRSESQPGKSVVTHKLWLVALELWSSVPGPESQECGRARRAGRGRFLWPREGRR